MTAPDQSTAPATPLYTDRTLPAPWVKCSFCKSPTPGLPDLDGLPLCPECAQTERLNDAARVHLAQMLAPVLGAWGHHYAAQGVTLEDLCGCLEQVTAAWANEEHQRETLTALLTEAMCDHAPPSFTPAPPDRVTLDARTLPQLLAARLDTTRPAPLDSPEQIDRRVSFQYQDTDGRVSETGGLGPGRDAVLILNTNPEHDALLYFTGMHGQTETDPRYAPQQNAYRVPAHLLPQVRASLGYFGSAGGSQ